MSNVGIINNGTMPFSDCISLVWLRFVLSEFAPKQHANVKFGRISVKYTEA